MQFFNLGEFEQTRGHFVPVVDHFREPPNPSVRYYAQTI
jgi:hypothetical protein